MTESQPTQISANSDDFLHLLRAGTLSLEGLLPWSSNYTFLGTVTNGETTATVVYKPDEGERPLWDFPYGTLSKREVAAWEVSEALGWDLVPPTVYREGPHGAGMVQVFVPHDPEEHYFTFTDENLAEIPLIAAFDVLINNADRKAGHCLRGKDGTIWCIDHGICFHREDKLRTVIWEFAGQPLPDAIIDDLEALQPKLRSDAVLVKRLRNLLSDAEIEALRRRLTRLLTTRRYPEPGPGRNRPWPLV